MKKGKLTITLKSDLCAGSGFSFGGSVDSDVVYDDYGFPFIPGKRIKGCMREAAINLLGWTDDEVFKFFGRRGADSATGIKIGNACLKDSARLNDEIEHSAKKYKDILTRQNVLQFYTGVRAQTKIDENSKIAKENTLRFTRVVHHYLPCMENEVETQFEAIVIYNNDSDVDKLKELALATRNIGLNRSRGMGSVRMKFTSAQEDQSSSFIKCEPYGEDYRISYCICSKEPIMVSAETDDKSEGFISGSSVIGALVKEYQNTPEMKDDEFFNRVFLSDQVVFSYLMPAYIVEGDKIKKYYRAYPAPLYINRMKKSKVLINQYKVADKKIDEKAPANWMYIPENGNQPKKLKSEYIATIAGEKKVIEPAYEIAYHHRKKDHKEEDEQLYFFETLAQGQYYAGDILLKKGDNALEDGQKLCDLLSNANLTFGKSKSAQYGRCDLVDYVPVDTENCSSYKKGEKVVVTLLSDAIFCDEYGNYTVCKDDVIQAVEKELGLKDACDKNQVFLDIRILTGYMSVWNMQKEQTPAIAAGSSFLMEVPVDNWQAKSFYIGERNVEGLGHIQIEPFEEMLYIVATMEDKEVEESQLTDDRLIAMYKTICLDKLIAAKINNFRFDAKLIAGMTASQVGRITLMLEEAIKSNHDTLNEFQRRVSSIKNNTNRNVSFELIQMVLGDKIKPLLDEHGMVKEASLTPDDVRENVVKHLKKMYENKKEKDLTEEEKDLKDIALECDDDQLYERWPEYMRAILVRLKYAKKD